MSVNLGLVSPAPVRGLGLVLGRELVPGNRGIALSGREPAESVRNGRGAVLGSGWPPIPEAVCAITGSARLALRPMACGAGNADGTGAGGRGGGARPNGKGAGNAMCCRSGALSEGAGIDGNAFAAFSFFETFDCFDGLPSELGLGILRDVLDGCGEG